MDNLVSIITPVYNAENYVEETINSVLNQTYKNYELIIVNDFSSDNSENIIKRLMKNDQRIKYIKQEENQGVSSARNTGIKSLKGRFIAFLDADDLWSYDKLEKQIRFMLENDLAITYTAYDVIDKNGIRMNKIISVPYMVSYNELLKENIIGCFTVVIDLEKLGNVSMPQVGHEDYVTWLSILKKGYKAYGINEVLGSYRKLNSSLSSNKFKCAKWTWNIYKNIEKLPLHKSVYYFLKYTKNGIRKHVFSGFQKMEVVD